MGHAWSGDLGDFTTKIEHDDSEIAAIAVAKGITGRGWINTRHVPLVLIPYVTLWCQHVAARRAPWGVMMAGDLARLVAILGREQTAGTE